jgi:folate-dependent phosphoribosylglycinamide formyltransferase PurN
VRVVVLSASHLDPFERAVLESLSGEGAITLMGAVIDDRPGDGVRSRLRREFARGRGAYVSVMIASAMWRRLTEPSISAQEWFAAHHVPTISTDDLYSKPSLDFITRHQPDCLFRNGFGIIQEPILSIAPRGVLSYHHGDLRRYRGAPYGFWELLHGERSMRATVQVLSAQLDAGSIVIERSIPILPHDTCHRLRKRARDLSVPLAREACLRISDPTFQPVALTPHELGTVYTLPKLRTWLRLWVNLLRRWFRDAISRPRIAEET